MVDTVSTQAQTNPAAQEISPEYSPMTGIDEFLIHNSPMPVRVMYTPDVRAYERLWFTCQDRSGDLLIITGLGFYPNLNTAEAYAIVNLRGRLTHVHAHRRLGDNRMNMRVGPLNFEILEPFKHWRLTLGENRYGVAYELHWYDTKRAVFQGGGMRAGQQLTSLAPDSSSGYESFGRIDGWASVDGERFTLDTGTYSGSRDHHWGTRDGVGGKPHSRQGAGEVGFFPSCGQWIEFKDWSIWWDRDLYNIGDPRPGAGRYRADRRRLQLKFEPESHIFKEGIVTNELDDGTTRELHIRRLGYQVGYLRCGMYGGPNGGTPDGDIWHGMYVGDDVLGGGTYDTTKPEVQMQLYGLDDHQVEVSCGTETTIGIFEPNEPLTWEWCRDNRGGFSLLG